nr:MAG TPA: type AsnC-type helix-turn-helix domain [Caudoviricetes sp.]
MTQYELLKTAASLLTVLMENDIDAKDVKYIELYKDYLRLKKEGHKVGYVVYYLSQQYECSEATVYRVVKRMTQKIR